MADVDSKPCVDCGGLIERQPGQLKAGFVAQKRCATCADAHNRAKSRERNAARRDRVKRGDVVARRPGRPRRFVPAVLLDRLAGDPVALFLYGGSGGG